MAHFLTLLQENNLLSTVLRLLLAAVLVYMPYALAAAILTPLNHPAAQGTAWAAYEQEAAAQTPGAQRVRVLEHSDCLL